MAEPAPEVLTCGEAMLLMLAEPGMPLARAVNFRRAIGGAESNVAAGLARLGHRARWFGRVGADPAGEAVLAQLRADGVDVSYADVDPDAPTGMLLRDSHPQRAIDVQYYRAGSAASRLAPEHISAEVVEGVPKAAEQAAGQPVEIQGPRSSRRLRADLSVSVGGRNAVGGRERVEAADDRL